MTDRPILFSAPMVRALLAGTKTQTRRIIKPQPNLAPHHEPVRAEQRGDRGWVWMCHTDRPSYQFATGDWKSHFAVGDRLYVREHWRTGGQFDHVAPRDLDPLYSAPIGFIADEGPNTVSRTGRFRQGMHMPRWASRLTLHVTEVRVQRLQEIGNQDAVDEGIAAIMRQGPTRLDVTLDLPGNPGWFDPLPTDVYSSLWDSINGVGSWEANPWVIALTFTVEHANIDAARKAA